MNTPLSTYTVQLAKASNGNIHMTVTSRRTGEQHPHIAPIAMPGHSFPTPSHPDTKAYATALLATAGVITPRVQDAGLVWVSYGYTLHPGEGRVAALQAPVPELDFVPLPGTVNA